MYCTNTTGSLPAVHLPGVKTADIDAFAVPEYISACRLIQAYPQGQGNGNIFIEFLQGFVAKIVPSLVIHRKREKKKPLLN